MTYQPGYSEHHSPYYDDGASDGQADASRKEKNGMDPDKSWSAMYRRGYADGLTGAAIGRR